MWKWIHQAASPQTTYRWAKRTQPYISVACLAAFAYGLLGALLWAPADYQQGEVFRIIYIHVPAAVMSLLVYSVMAVSALLFFVWKIKVADSVAKVSAPIGAVFTLVALVTGSIWGKPTWGTYWIWDARLTSELVLLFVYLGIIVLRQSLPDATHGAKASGLLTLVGTVNLPIIHYSVVWWHTLHQGATILKLSKPSIAPNMLHPLLGMLLAYLLYYVWVLLIKLRLELLLRESKTKWVSDVLSSK